MTEVQGVGECELLQACVPFFKFMFVVLEVVFEYY